MKQIQNMNYINKITFNSNNKLFGGNIILFLHYYSTDTVN
jgi:hypothetical protein